MDATQTSYISSTFWSERIGPTAALKSMEVLEQLLSWESITQTGLDIKTSWQRLAKKCDLKIVEWGIPALAGFSILGPNALAYKTVITQEMLAKGFLASNSIYFCIDHTTALLESYLDALDPVFHLIKECEKGRDVSTVLKSLICHNGFQRLN